MKDSNRPLWAPWRIDFIRSKKPSECFLCINEINAETQENHIIYRGESCFVILNKYPYNSGHLLIAPYRHIDDLDKSNGTERIEMMDLCVKSEKVLKQVMNPEAFNIGFNLGIAAGAGVKDHIHMHIVPRWNGDTNFMPVFSNTRVVPEALDETAKLLKAAW
jgi:ATP adenylyltransferase